MIVVRLGEEFFYQAWLMLVFLCYVKYILVKLFGHWKGLK
jgi:hypothetical protein